MRCIIRIVVGVVLSIVVASSANASIQSAVPLGGNVGVVFLKLDPPLPLLNDGDNFFSPGRIEADNVKEAAAGGAYEKTFLGFDEQGQAIIGDGSTPGGADLKVDLLADGMGGSAGPGVLAAGGKVTSHYLFFDPKFDNGGAIAEFEITFDYPIVGVIYSTLNLFDSDYLGLPEQDLFYNTDSGAAPDRPGFDPNWPVVGLDLDNTSDFVTITGTNTIEVRLSRVSGNFLRVITVPEPTTFVVWSLLGVFGMGFGRRRRNRPATFPAAT